jgi:transcriptional regulator with XRE-family HTH domain
MAKEITNTEEVEVEEVEETEEAKGMRPKDLAAELGIDPKTLRGWLRKEFPRNPNEKNTSWALTEEQIDAAYGRFSKDEEPETDDTDSDEEEA